MKAVSAIAVMSAGIMTGAFAQGQATRDYAEGNRLIINGQPLFISGMNLAWNNFARDVGDNAINRNAMTNYIKQIRGAGGNALRWWLHTDATHCPKLNDNGAVTGIGSQTINNIRAVLDSAHAYGVVVSLCLFSFDILHNDGFNPQTGTGGNKNAVQMDRNQKFMTVEANLDSYIQNALRPILQAVGSHPAIMCWEVFNEPEGMTQHGWATTKIDHSHVIRFTAKIAGEVRRNTTKMASTGIHNFHRYVDLYTTAKLTAVDPDGWLDFYMAHHYPEHESRLQSPFYNAASVWGFDRPVLIGEFPARSWGPGQYPHFYNGQPLDIKDAYEYAYLNGYCGVMSWSMTENNTAKFGNFATTEPALKYMFDKYKADIEVKGGGNVTPPQTGDHVMRIAFNNLATGDANEVLLKEETSFSGRTNLTFEMYIHSSSGSSLRMYPVIQTGESDDYGWYTVSAPINIGTQTKGQWITITVPINTLRRNGTGAVLGSSASSYAVFFKFVSEGSPFTGTIYIDNIKVDNFVIADFDEPYSEWSIADGEADVSRVTRASVGGNVSISGQNGLASSSAIRAPAAIVTGKTLRVTSPDNSDLRIRMINVQGRTVKSFKAKGNADLPLKNIPAGRYFVEIKKSGKMVSTSAVTVR